MYTMSKIILLSCILLTGCASSRTTFTRISPDKYEVYQAGNADVEVDAKGNVKIKNPQSTLKGCWIEFKNMTQGVLSVVKPTAEVN